MNNDCSKTINEALAAGGSIPSLSKFAANHIATCPDCQKTLAALAILSSSKSTALLAEDNTALKAKILSKLKPAVIAKTTAASTTGSIVGISANKILICSGVAAAVLVGSSYIEHTNNTTIQNFTNNSAPITENSSRASDSIIQNTELENSESLKDLNPASATFQTVPSSTKD